MPDVDRLLARVGLKERPAATREGLHTLHRAYVSRMPYETLAIFLGETAPLDLDALQARVLQHGRGGYCFELNGLLAGLLEALGFVVERREARCGAREDPGGLTNHLGLVVRVPGVDGAWFADAGLGEGWLDPLLLHEGVVAGPGRLGWTLERLPDAQGWWITHHPWGSFPGVHLTDPVVELPVFAPHHERLSCHPDSPFMPALVIQQVHDDRITTLRARTLTERGPGRNALRTLAGEADLTATLAGEFGITLPPEQTAALWATLTAQHERWLASRAPS